MYISNRAIKSLKTYMILLSMVFIIFIVLIVSAAYYDSAAYYAEDWNTFEQNFDISIVLYAISFYVIITGMIMVFVITGILLCINRFKMKKEDRYVEEK